jgi:Ca2+:H+ antiporter
MSNSGSTPVGRIRRAVLGEAPIAAGLAGVGILSWSGYAARPVLADGAAAAILLFLGIFAVMLWCVFAVTRHADFLAERLGEPYGTLVLTLSATVIEAATISTIMLHGENNPTLARDTMFAALMIILNGMVGLSLLVGAIRHREQVYNLQGAGAFLNVLVPLSILTLVLPNFTRTTPGPRLSGSQGAFLAVVAVLLYGVFLAIQTVRHRAYFDVDDPAPGGHPAGFAEHRPSRWHALGLVGALVPVVFLAEALARYVDLGIEELRAPPALGGVLIAILVLAPEALASFRAALANRVQRSVNICLGSALATISLTVPMVLLIAATTGRTVELGLGDLGMVLLAATLLVSVVTFASGRTNVLQGAIHLILFASYVFFVIVP